MRPLAVITASIILLGIARPAAAQCPPQGITEKPALARALASCLGDRNPAIRDQLAFEGLSRMMRASELDRTALGELKTLLIALMDRSDPSGFQRPFAILTLAEVARTDRLKPWMTDPERHLMVDVAANYLTTITDHRAFTDQEGFRHGVAHGADFALQLALNPAIDKPQLDRLLAAIAAQVLPKNQSLAYWAGEPDRLARAVVSIAQRKLHSDAEWKNWFAALMNPAPMDSWAKAFSSESGIKKRHNARAFLLSVFATAITTEDAGIRQLAAPARDSLKLVP
jgi:Protein of unknown function (DUF2785)